MKKPVNKEPAMIISTSEKKRLDSLEEVVDDHITSFIEVGKALKEIREKGLYYYRAKNWDEYITKCWPKQLSKRHADRMIAATYASEVVDGLEIEAPPTGVSTGAPKSQILTVGKTVNLDKTAAFELSKAEDETKMASIVSKAVEYVKPEKDGTVTITQNAIKKAVEAATVASMDEDEPDDEEEELSVQDEAAAISREIEAFAKSLMNQFTVGLKGLSAAAKSFLSEAGRDDSAESNIKSAQATARMAKTVVCPVCEGEGCHHCKQERMVTTFTAKGLKGVTL